MRQKVETTYRQSAAASRLCSRSRAHQGACVINVSKFIYKVQRKREKENKNKQRGLILLRFFESVSYHCYLSDLSFSDRDNCFNIIFATNNNNNNNKTIQKLT